jgi:hypothetical protein
LKVETRDHIKRSLKEAGYSDGALASHYNFLGMVIIPSLGWSFGLVLLF